MKIVTMAVAILLNTLAPTLALAATYLEGAEANANTLVRDVYVQVTYRDSNDEKKMEKGWIDAVGETSFTVREGGFRGKKTIAYDKVVSVIMSDESTAPVKQMNEVNRFIREMKAREIEQTKKEKEAKEEQIKREAEQAAIQRLKQRLKDKVVMIGQFDLSKKEWYAHVVYTSKEGDKRTAIGQIIKQDTDHIVIRVQEKGGLKIRKTIAYTDIDTLFVARQPRNIEEWQNARHATKLLNQNTVLIMPRGQIDLSKIRTGWYAHVVYTSKEGATRTATGRIVNKDTTRIFVKDRIDRMTTYTTAYGDMDTLVVAKQWQDIERYRETGARYKTRVRVHVSLPSRWWMIGEVIKMTPDTLVIQRGRKLVSVPRSAISNIEVSLRQHRNTGKGLVVGLALNALLWGSFDADEETIGAAYFMMIMTPSLLIIPTFIGAMIKSDKWVEVPPQRLNLSLAPTSTKGLRAALTFNF